MYTEDYCNAFEISDRDDIMYLTYHQLLHSSISKEFLIDWISKFLWTLSMFRHEYTINLSLNSFLFFSLFYIYNAYQTVYQHCPQATHYQNLNKYLYCNIKTPKRLQPEPLRWIFIDFQSEALVVVDTREIVCKIGVTSIFWSDTWQCWYQGHM